MVETEVVETAAAGDAVLEETSQVMSQPTAPTPASPDLPSEWGGGAGVSGAR